MRSFILIGWAFAIIWIYLGNLVNFHQHRIWGKQLLPVACSTTRSKEKDSTFYIKSIDDIASFSEIAMPIAEICNYHLSLSVSDSQCKSFIDAHLSCLYQKQFCESHLLRGPPQA